METLPCEIWDLILRQLAVHDIHSAAITCKWFYGLVDNLYGSQFKIPSGVLLHKKMLIRDINTIFTYYFRHKYPKQKASECFEITSCIIVEKKYTIRTVIFYYRTYYETPDTENSYKCVPRHNVLHTYNYKDDVNASYLTIDYFRQNIKN